MTVAELIEALKGMPQDLPVYLVEYSDDDHRAYEIEGVSGPHEADGRLFREVPRRVEII